MELLKPQFLPAIPIAIREERRTPLCFEVLKWADLLLLEEGMVPFSRVLPLQSLADNLDLICPDVERQVLSSGR